MPDPQKSYRFAVAFSFAGSHREKVRAIAMLVSESLNPGLQDRTARNVFFDEWFEDELGGDDAEAELQRIYGKQSLMVVADVSEDYSGRPWCQAEARAVRALRMTLDTARDPVQRKRLAYIRFNDGEVPGVLENAITWDGEKKTPKELADLILSRLKKLQNELHIASAIPRNPPIPILFYHPATNDDCYSRREKELKWLDECAKNPDVRIATITGQGGLGKTSLVGHWISKHSVWKHRTFRGVFFYSFYSNRDPIFFFDALLKFISKEEQIVIPGNTPLYQLAESACRKWSYLVVLDGLELLQHDENDSARYGWISDGELTEFVARIGEKGASLLLLTSRFPFSRITDEYPKASRALELSMFTGEEGADLLKVCEVQDTPARLREYSELLGGHPLALRIFAGVCLERSFGEPESVIAYICSPQDVETMPDPGEHNITQEERQKRRQRRQFYKLLRWYQQSLTPSKRRLLQLVALFRDPVRTETLTSLAIGLEAMRLDFNGCGAATIAGLLNQLSRQFLLQKEESFTSDVIRWTTHPIVRDVFRQDALSAGQAMAKQFAQIVAGKGATTRPRKIEEVLPIVEAIEVLIAAGDYLAADDLYRGRLEDGWIFQFIPAPEEGLRCARAFLFPIDRRVNLERSLGPRRLAFYLNSEGLLSSILGDMHGILQKYADHNGINRTFKEWTNVSTGLRNIAVSQIITGNLKDAVISASEALFYAGGDRNPSFDDLPFDSTTWRARTLFPTRPKTLPPHDPKQELNSRICRANALSLCGQLVEASRDFAFAMELFQRVKESDRSIDIVPEYCLASHCFRLGRLTDARRLASTAHSYCDRHSWIGDRARCDLVLCELDLFEGDLRSANMRINRSLRVFREARQGQDLPTALLLMSRVRRSDEITERLALGGLKGTDKPQLESRIVTPVKPDASSFITNEESALSHCEEALRLAARSGFLLKKCDSLNLRARLLMEFNEFDKALADAEEAQEIALRCNYCWGQLEALRQLRDCYKALNRSALYREWEGAERALAEEIQSEIRQAIGFSAKAL